MKPQNKYLSHSHISEAKFRQILKEFCRDSTASETSDRVSISRPTINTIYMAMRKRIYNLAIREGQEVFENAVEIDESYFGARRVRGKRGRGAMGKVPVFGILKRGGKVYTRIVKNCSRAELLPILKGKVLDGTTVYSDGWRPYDGLVYNYDHYRVYHSKNEFARGKNHINGIEYPRAVSLASQFTFSFWSWAKRRLQKFNGISKKYFQLHLKECEWRFNHRQDDTYEILLKEFRDKPLNY